MPFGAHEREDSKPNRSGAQNNKRTIPYRLGDDEQIRAIHAVSPTAVMPPTTTLCPRTWHKYDDR